MPNDDAMERARKLVEAINPSGCVCDTCIVPITQALLEARDAGLEEAAGIADLYRSSSGSFIAAAIRRAKSKPGV